MEHEWSVGVDESVEAFIQSLLSQNIVPSGGTAPS